MPNRSYLFHIYAYSSNPCIFFQLIRACVCSSSSKVVKSQLKVNCTCVKTLYQSKMFLKWISVAVFISFACNINGFNNERVNLRDVNVVTLYQGRMTNGRRSAPVPQLKCVGGTAGCSVFVPQVVQCYNRGFDGRDYQWECKTDMDEDYRFGLVEVVCEGYDYPDDPYILAGSCGLEYTIDLTKSGQDKHYHQQNSYGGSGGAYDNSHQQKSSWYKTKSHKHMGIGWNAFFLIIVCVIIYILYKYCIVPAEPGAGHTSGTNPTAPPPPGFRPEYMPGSDDHHGGAGGHPSQPPPSYESCASSGYGSSGSYTHNARPAGSGVFGNMFGGGNRRNGGGFWSGAATGGFLGYLFGSRNNNRYQQPPYPGGYGAPTGSTWGSGWGNSGWGNSGWGGGLGSSRNRGSFGGSTHSTSYSAPSSGTRTASGFGGTRRR